MCRRCGRSCSCLSGTYSQLLDYIIFAVLVFYILTIAGLVCAALQAARCAAAVQRAGISGAAGALHRPGRMDLYRIIAIQAPVHVAGPGAWFCSAFPSISSGRAGRRVQHSVNVNPHIQLLRRKSLVHVQTASNQTHVDADRERRAKQGEHTLKRSLGALNLITLGIGAVIGAGIFVLTGQAAALHAGPAVALSFVLAGITCAFAGLCYAEFASIIPIAGSAYTYGYATLGELVAWIIGWDLVLEYAFGAATVASGWAGYFNSLLQQLGIYIPPQLHRRRRARRWHSISTSGCRCRRCRRA